MTVLNTTELVERLRAVDEHEAHRWPKKVSAACQDAVTALESQARRIHAARIAGMEEARAAVKELREECQEVDSNDPEWSDDPAALEYADAALAEVIARIEDAKSLAGGASPIQTTQDTSEGKEAPVGAQESGE